MPIMRTATVDVDVEKTSDFDLDVEICKAQEISGRRFLTGVASGVLEDADGERVSKRSIANMASQAVAGLKLVAGSHAQDWHNEIGDLVRLDHDPEHDELLVKCELPPQGEDPIADKAWNRQTKYGEKLGFSIGGKLTKHYFELTDTGKKRKVLDGITLKHVALTKKPAYRQSFAMAVAKTAEAIEAPADDAFTIEAEPEGDGEIVAKMEGWADPDVDVAKESSEAVQAGERGNAGTQGPDTQRPDVSGDDAKNTDKDLPEGTGERHLACPNCGHEFAAAMPADKDTPADAAGDKTTGKRAADPEEEVDVPLDKTLANLRSLAGISPDAEVAKTDEENEEAPATDLADVEKLVAASHEASAETIGALKDSTAKGFDLVAKTLKEIQTTLLSFPAGRKSLARAAASDGDGAAPRSEVETVAKTDAEFDEELGKIAKVDPVKALAMFNERNSGIESSIASRPTGSAALAHGAWDED